MFGFFGSLIQLILQFLTGERIVKLISDALSSEIAATSLYPHIVYNIMSGTSFTSGAKTARTHIGPVNVYTGAPTKHVRAAGTAKRLGRIPFIPMIPLYGLQPKSSSIMACAEPNQTGVQCTHYASVNFHGICTKPTIAPIISLHDVHIGNLSIMANMVSVGLAFGPTALVTYSQMYRMLSTVMATSDTKHYDFAFAMSPAALLVYDRIE